MIATVIERATIESVLASLSATRIREISREAGLAARGRSALELARSTARAQRLSFRSLLNQLRRDELRAACRAHQLDEGGRARQMLMKRLLDCHGDQQSIPPAPLFTGSAPERSVPRASDTVVVRHRQWLVDEVVAPVNEGDATWVKLTCLDDDHRGVALELLWELELGARVIRPEASLLDDPSQLDPPRKFAAYLNTLRWQGVSAAEKNHFQSPFRAGIQVLAHQLTPLQKALDLPRANLFIADDVGLGKTIEAGLILQELQLRQRVEFSLIVCPASITLQWQSEMEQRFGLRFEIYNRDFVAARRRERGFGVNAWATHPRFIISYPLLRRPEYREPLLAQLGMLRGGSTRARKSLLILDEAHTAAPSSGGIYAVDSQTTHVVRDVAQCFENRLFLSATPHNGHSNSFSALLEILDPQRFMRAVPVTGPEQLAPVMVRRLKRDLRALTHTMRFPERKVVRIALEKEGETWRASGDDGFAAELPPREGGDELELAAQLAEYTALYAGQPKTKRLALINLQKRLLSSVEAFHRTLEVHIGAKGRAGLLASHGGDFEDGLAEEDARYTYGLDEEMRSEREQLAVQAATAQMTMPEGAAALLGKMQVLARGLRREPDAKFEALLAWMREALCPGLALGVDAPVRGKAGKWSERRVLIFTEYGDTLRYLRELLREAAAGTEQADARILQIHGGMGEEARQDVQHAFNAPAKEEPLRILLATDAAREGLNLQGCCADLFHYDIPWNPSRMEQRNGRIDRALQPQPEVRCHYFVYTQRPEDRVLEKVVEKTEVIARELGSLGQVVSERVERALSPGIVEDSARQLDLAAKLGETALGPAHDVAERELEQLRQKAGLQREIDDALKTYEASRKRMRFRPEHLRDALDVGLDLYGLGPLTPIAAAEADGAEGTFALPELPADWQPTLDALRPPRGRDEPFFEWRKRAPLPVVFKPPEVLTQAHVHLHLQHPFVQRVLSRYATQGFSSHDLSRVSAVAVPDVGETFVVALGRLCLFGMGAGRLHDDLLCVAARLSPAGGRESDLEILSAQASLAKLEELERLLEARPELGRFAESLQRELCADAKRVAPRLWGALREEADALAVKTEQKLERRGREEAKALEVILRAQQAGIDKALGAGQLGLDFVVKGGGSEAAKKQAKQGERDREHLRGRRDTIDRELLSEPAELQAIYEVKLRRFEPVGLVFLYPEMRL